MIHHCSDHHADGPAAEAGESGPAADAVPRAGHLLPPRDGGVRGRLRHCRDPQHRGQHPQLLQATQPSGHAGFFSTFKIAKCGTCTLEGLSKQCFVSGSTNVPVLQNFFKDWWKWNYSKWVISYKKLKKKNLFVIFTTEEQKKRVEFGTGVWSGPVSVVVILC